MPYFGQGAVAGIPPMGPADALMAQYATINRQNPEWLFQPIYDRVNYPAAGAATMTFFTNPVGSSATLIRAGVAAAINKTYRDSNLTQQGVFGIAGFLIYGLSFTLIPLQQAPGTANTGRVAEDFAILVEHGWLDFRTQSKTLLYLPLDLLDWHFFIGANFSTTAGPFTLVSPLKSEQYVVRPELAVQPNQNFQAYLNFDGSPATTQTCDIKMALIAGMQRPS